MQMPKISPLVGAMFFMGCAMQSAAFGGGNASDYFSDTKATKLANAAAAGDVSTVDALKKDGADVNAVGKDGMTPLLWAFSKGSKDGVSELLALGADPNHQTDSGDSLVSLASQLSDPAMLTMAMQHGGNANLKIAKGPYRSPLMQAIGPGRLSEVKALVDAGADVNYQDPISGNTPMIQAAQINQFDIVYYFLEHGADYRLKNRFGNTVTYFVENNNIDPANQLYAWRQKVIAYLAGKGVTVNPKIP